MITPSADLVPQLLGAPVHGEETCDDDDTASTAGSSCDASQGGVAPLDDGTSDELGTSLAVQVAHVLLRTLRSKQHRSILYFLQAVRNTQQLGMGLDECVRFAIDTVLRPRARPSGVRDVRSDIARSRLFPPSVYTSLRREFDDNDRPNVRVYKRLAAETGLTKRQVQGWFSNMRRRQREGRDVGSVYRRTIDEDEVGAAEP